MQIPEYKLRAWLSRYRRIALHASCSGADTRTTNALRLARKDAKEIERLMLKKNG